MAKDCTCYKCKAACTNKPGWFLPGEAERAADYLGITLEEFFTTKLGVDWYEGDLPVFVLSPAITSMSAGETFPSNPMGTCVFFENGRCSIHAVKPFECRAFLHGQSHVETTARHEGVADAWQAHQAQIEVLLGDRPEPTEADIFDLFGMLGMGGS
jgi:Fe-S-cluster containining protein